MNLHGALDALTCTLDALKAQLDALNAQIRELKAENERLTEALRKVSECPCGDKYCEAAEIAREALNLIVN